MDIVLLAALVLAFATFATVHLAISVRLALRTRPRWRGALAFFVPPLAPIWAFREGWPRSASLWLAAVLIYVVALIVAS